MPPALGFGLLWVLRTLAAHDVRDDGTYLFFYMAMGAGWLAAGGGLLSLFGISHRDDVCERGNAAAAWALA